MFWYGCGIVLATYYFVFVRRAKYWANLGVPQADAWKVWLVAAKDAFQEAPFQDSVLRLYRKCSGGRYFGGYRLFKPVLYLKDSDLARSIWGENSGQFTDAPSRNDPLWRISTLTVPEDTWKSVKAALPLALNEDKLKEMFDPMVKHANKFVKHFEEKNTRTLSIELKDAFGRMAVDMAAYTFLGLTNDSILDQDNELFNKLKENANSNDWKFVLTKHFPQIAKTFGLHTFNQELTTLVRELIHNSKKNEDFEKSVFSNLQAEMKRKLTNEEHVAVVTTLMSATFEKVSSLMCFMAYDLTINPFVHNKLTKEVMAFFEACEGFVTYDAVMNLPYLDAVVKETMRKWPIIFTMERICSKGYTIPALQKGEKPIHLRKGDILELPIYSIHRDAQLFPDASHFKPERFMEPSQPNLGSYMPFGVGSRQCIASKLAIFQVKILFVHILRIFALTGVEESPIPVVTERDNFKLDIKGDMMLGVRLKSAKFEGIR